QSQFEQTFSGGDVRALFGVLTKGLNDFADARGVIRFIGRVPPEALDRQGGHVERVDSPASEGVEERQAIAQWIAADQLEVCSHQRPEVIAESQIHGRTVVQSADADVEHLSRGARGFYGQSADEIRRQPAVWENAG